MERLLTATTASCAALALAACATQGGVADPIAEEADYRVSVEIPLGGMHVAEGEILKVNELLDERTDFDADDFLLDEVVLVARSNAETEASAELLVVEWRSGQVAIPAGDEEAWYEVRVPAPGEDLGGAWLLDIVGDATVDMVVAVLEPRPERVAEARTVYRTTTVYRSAPVREVYWIYDPARYYVYHYYGAWPYRYFVGPWSYRYYDLAYRPYRYHYGPLLRPRIWRDRDWRDRGRPRSQRPRADRNVVDAAPRGQPRRIAPELVQLRRAHPRLRVLAGNEAPRRSVRDRRGRPQPTATASASERGVERRTTPRATTTAAAQRSAGTRTLRRPGAERSTATAERRSTIPSLRGRTSRPAAGSAQRTDSGIAAPRRSTERRAAAPRTRTFERSSSASRQGRRSTATAPRATDRVSTPRRAVTTQRPVVRSSGQRTATPRATRAQPSRTVQRQRSAPSRPSVETRRTVQPRRAVQPRRTVQPHVVAEPRRTVTPRRTATPRPAPVRTRESSANRPAPRARPAPAQQPARSNARQQRAANEAPASDGPRSRRFERR